MLNLLDVDTYRETADSYSYGILGMRDTELNVRTSGNERFAVFSVDELGRGVVERRRNSSDEFEEHEVGLEAAEASVSVGITESLLASLWGNEGKHARHFGVGAEVHMGENLN